MVHDRISVVMISWNRRAELLATLARIEELSEAPAIVVVDNGSSDGTAAAVAERFPRVEVIEAGRNLGAVGRNLGVRRVATPFVAFCDDDSWPEPGCLEHAVRVFDSHPELAVLCGRVLVGPENVEDPICTELEESPVPAQRGMPGPPLLGFLAGASVVRREAFLQAGGFTDRFQIGGEEELLAVDLAAAGWWICYDSQYVVHHHPSPSRNSSERRATVIRNGLWAAWLRRSWPGALRKTVRLARDWRWDAVALRGVLAALFGLPWILRHRNVVPKHIEAALELLDVQKRRSTVRGSHAAAAGA
jgi:GT2 family glycosyltransferase